MVYTFDGIKQTLKDKLSLLSNWSKTFYYSTYDRILDVLAYTGELIVYAAEYFYKESLFGTAEKRSSVFPVALDLLGYTPYRKKGASGTILICADSAFGSTYSYTGNNIIIPKWTVFTDEDNTYSVYTTSETTYSTGYVGPLKLSVKVGTPKSYTYTSTGSKNESFNIYSESIENDVIDAQMVDLEGTKLATVNIVNNLYLVNDLTIYSCRIRSADDNTFISIKFGDGVTARQLMEQEHVKINYAETTGDKSDISNSNVITKIPTQLQDILGNNVTLYVKNTEAILGGTDFEDLDSIKYNAPQNVIAASLLSSKDNWISTIKKASFVNKPVVWTLADLGSSYTDIANNTVYWSAVSTSGVDLTSTQQSSVLADYITPKKSLTEGLVYQSLKKVFLKVNVEAKIKNNTQEVMLNNIKNTIYNTYSSTNVEFQQSVYDSQMGDLISEIENILYHSFDMKYLEKNLAADVTNTELLTSYTSGKTSILENQQYLVDNSFEIWVKLKGRLTSGVWEAPLLIGTTSGTTVSSVSGTGFTVNNGFVNYTTNVYSFSIPELISGTNESDTSITKGYVLCISYKMKDGNSKQTNSVRLSQFNQITDIDKDFVTATLTYKI